MTLNLFVPFGEVVFTVFDDRRQGQEAVLSQHTLSREQYGCLTVPPMGSGSHLKAQKKKASY